MQYKLIIDTFGRDEWEYHAAGFADYSLYQTWSYQKTRARMQRCKLSRAIIKDHTGQALTMCQTRIITIKPINLKIAYIQWGPLVRRRNDKIDCSPQALKLLVQAYLSNSADIIRIVPNLPDNDMTQNFTETLLSAGFNRIPGDRPYRTIVLPLDKSEQDLRMGLRKSWRRDLNRAQRAKIKITEQTNGSCLEVLQQLYTELLKRKNFKGLSPAQFVETQNLLCENEKMKVIVAYLDNKPITVHLTSRLGDTAIAILAAGSPEALTCSSSYLAWWQAFVNARQAGMKKFDLGGIDPDNNQNVYLFKSRVGGQQSCHIGSFEAYRSPAVKSASKIAHKLRCFIKR